MIKNILQKMLINSNISPILIGEPGTGKTTFVKELSILTGIPLIHIEAPHISEEHLGNIPFIIKIEEELSVIRAESHLITVLKKQKVFSNEKHLDLIKKHNLYQEYIENKGIILKIRENIKSILFIDEFYRVKSVKISNLLRGILNRKIGADNLPDSIFPIFASNNDLNDQGLQVIPENHQFKLFRFDNTNNNAFLKYLKKKKILSGKILTIFSSHLECSNFLNKDFESGLTISPRRMEEILKIVNSLYHLKNKENNFYKVISISKIHFFNYSNNTYSSLYPLFIKFLEDLWEQEYSDLFEPNEFWSDKLEKLIHLKQHIGIEKKYIPCLSGLHGISKTSSINSISNKLNLNLIKVDCSYLNNDDTIGLPLSKNQNETFEIDFSEPLLYSIIMKLYNQSKIDNKDNKDRKYNHILFLDELSRANPSVLNSIRKILLDKSVNEIYKLPEDILIVCAMNNKGEGTYELTPHIKDVLEIIECHPNYEKTINYIKKLKIIKEVEKSSQLPLFEVSEELFNTIFNRFKNDCNSSEIDFFFDTLYEKNIYISPRVIDSFFQDFFHSVSFYIEENQNELNNLFQKPEHFIHFLEEILDLFFISFKENITFSLIQKKINNNEIEKILFQIKILIFNEGSIIFDKLKLKKSKNIISIKDIFLEIEHSFTKQDLVELSFVFSNYIFSVEDNQVINELNYIINDLSIKKLYLKNYKQFYTEIDLLYTILKNVKLNNNLKERASILLLESLKSFNSSLLNSMIIENNNENIEKFFEDIYNSNKYDLLNTHKDWFKNEKILSFDF